MANNKHFLAEDYFRCSTKGYYTPGPHTSHTHTPGTLTFPQTRLASKGSTRARGHSGDHAACMLPTRSACTQCTSQAYPLPTADLLGSQLASRATAHHTASRTPLVPLPSLPCSPSRQRRRVHRHDCRRTLARPPFPAPWGSAQTPPSSCRSAMQRLRPGPAHRQPCVPRPRPWLPWPCLSPALPRPIKGTPRPPNSLTPSPLPPRISPV